MEKNKVDFFEGNPLIPSQKLSYPVTVIIHFVYLAIFEPLHLMSNGLIALALIPTLVASWYFGIIGGVVSSIFIFIASTSLIAFYEHGTFIRIMAEGGWIGFITLLLFGIFVGWLRSILTHMRTQLITIKTTQHELETSDNLRRSSEELSHNLVNLIDSNGEFVYMSPLLLELLGYSEESNKHLNIADLLFPEDVIRFNQNLHQLFLSEINYSEAEYRLTSPANKIRWAIISCTSKQETNQKETAVLITFRDISAQKDAEFALRESEGKYRLVVETSSDAIFLQTFKGMIIDCNNAACTLFGYTKNELVHLNILDLIPASFHEIIQVNHATEFLTGGNALELQGLRKEGSTFPCLINTRVIQLAGDDLIIAFVHDNTLQKNAEAVIRQSETRYRNLFDDSPISLWEEDFSSIKTYLGQLAAQGVKDFHTYFTQHPDEVNTCFSLLRILDVNSTSVEIFNAHNKAELLANISSILLPTSQEVLNDELCAISLGKTGFEGEGVGRKLTGELMNINFKWAVVSGYEESMQKVILSITNITARKAAEQGMHDALQHFESIIENTPFVAIEGFDRNGIIHHWNSASTALYGFSTAEAVGQPLQDLILEGMSSTEFLDQIHTIWDTGIASNPQEWPVCSYRGESRWVYLSMFPIRENGKVVEIFCMNVDITKRKRDEQVQHAIYRISEATNSVKNQNELFSSIYQIISDLMPASNFYVALYDPKKQILTFPYWVDEVDACPAPRKLGRGTTEYVLTTGQSALIDPEVFDSLANKGFVENSGSDSIDWLGVPLKVDEVVIGVMAVQTYTPGVRYNNEHKEILEFVSKQVAIAIIRKRNEEALRESELRYSLAAHGANDGIWDWNLRTDEIYLSPRWKEILGFTDDQIGTSPVEWLNRIIPQDRKQVEEAISAHLKGVSSLFSSEYRMFHANGSIRWVLARGLAILDESNEPSRMAGSLTDITYQKEFEDQLRHDAMHDPLTGLFNRTFFIDQLKRSLERSVQFSNYSAAVFFLNVDRFKIINDSLGHLMGDQLLVAISKRLDENLPVGHVLARLGADEFAILLENMASYEDAHRITNNLLESLRIPFQFPGQTMFITASIGIAFTQPSYDQPEDLLRDADIAMDRAKKGGKTKVEIFNTSMHTQSLAKMRLEEDLRQALERDEFRLCYQPITSLSTNRITGIEALIRWEHPRRGLLYPVDFIKFAEEAGLSQEIDLWVLRTATMEIKPILSMCPSNDLKLSVNISPAQFQQPDFPAVLRSILREIQFPGQALCLEITEGTAMRDVHLTVQNLRTMSEFGVTCALDDFGKDYSTLNYIRRFPVHSIKIDQTFIQDLPENMENAAITTSIIAMSHMLKLIVVAEGVETTAQLNFLKQQNCDEIQGFIISRAVPVASIQKLLQDQL